jgi:TonB family protein
VEGGQIAGNAISVALNEFIVNAGNKAISWVTLLQIALAIYAIGVVLQLTRFIYHFYILTRLFIKSDKIKSGRFTFVLLPEGSASFSFFNWLFLDKTLIENNVNQIIAHEKIHSQQKHSIDILLLEFLLIWQWFNPFVYLLKKLVIENHEYLADQGTLFESRRVTEYKLLLLQNILNQSNYALTNNFSYSLIKKRLKMMEKKKSKLKMVFTAIGFTMIFALVTISCSNKINLDVEEENMTPAKKEITQPVEKSTNNNTGKETSEPVFTLVKVMPEYPGGTIALFEFLGNNLKYPERAKEQKIEGKVYVQFTVDSDGNVVDVSILRGIGGGCDEEAMRVVKLMHNWIPGEQDGKKVNVQYNLSINFTLE